MTLKGDVIVKEKLTGCLKNDTGNLDNFHTSSLKVCSLMGWASFVNIK